MWRSTRFYFRSFSIFSFHKCSSIISSKFVCLYADDTTIYDFQNDINQLKNNLQSSLESLHKWCKQNGMVLNADKTKVMLITSKQKRNCLQNPTLALRCNDTDIKMTTCDKILGIQVDEILWNNQCQQVYKKVSSYLWLLSKIRSFLSTEHRLLFYKAYI